MTQSGEARSVSAGRRRRRDAIENEARVLAAAVTTVLRHGQNVPMSVIASEAGVGVGTLYRKYPNREALLLALTERAFALLADIAESISGLDDTGQQLLNAWWDEIIEEYDQLVLPLGGGPSELTDGARRSRQRLHQHLTVIIDRGIRDKSLRPDVTLNDVVYFGAMLVAPFRPDLDWRPIARRQKQIHLEGLALTPS